MYISYYTGYYGIIQIVYNEKDQLFININIDDRRELNNNRKNFFMALSC